MDIRDPDVQEAIAEAAYMRERAEEAAADREHEMRDATYMVLAWECLDDWAKRPYRVAVATALDVVGAEL